MRKNQFGLRGALLAAALGAASANSSAGVISGSFDFDNVASGSSADSALGAYSSIIHFGNADTVADVDAFGDPTGTFHWVDGTASYGDVLAKNDGTAVSKPNVLWNNHQPILVMFSSPLTVAAFSIQADTSGHGNPGGTYMAFLDGTGHGIDGARFLYSAYANPGLLIQSTAAFDNVRAVLLSGDTSYDNMAFTAMPEPGTGVLLAGALALLGAMTRSRRF